MKKGGVCMCDLVYREPTINDEKIVMDYREEFVNYGIPKSVGFSLKDIKSYKEWFDDVQKKRTEKDIQTHFLVFRKQDNKLIGLLTIRHSLSNPLLLKYSGNIGYSVRPSERRKGYATKMLETGLSVCKTLNIDNALLICGEDNVGSKTCIENAGGVLDKKVPLDDGVIQLRYYIKTDHEKG